MARAALPLCALTMAQDRYTICVLRYALGRNRLRQSRDRSFPQKNGVCTRRHRRWKRLKTLLRPNSLGKPAAGHVDARSDLAVGCLIGGTFSHCGRSFTRTTTRPRNGFVNSHLDHCFSPSTLGRAQSAGPFVYLGVCPAISPTRLWPVPALGKLIRTFVSAAGNSSLHLGGRTWIVKLPLTL
jgi:hypothetical protein